MKKHGRSTVWSLLLSSIALFLVKLSYESRLLYQYQEKPTSSLGSSTLGWSPPWQASSPHTDWFDAAEWIRSDEHTCFYVEDICHQSNQLFYRPNSERRQPNFELQQFSPTIAKLGRFAKDVPLILVQPGDTDDLARCTDSPIQNHMLLSGDFNDMLGEFYVRALRGLFNIVSYHKIDLHLFRQHTQLYLHRQSRHAGAMLDSHSLFTNVWRGHPLVDFSNIMDSTTCRCLPRLLFCGYDTRPSGADGRLLVQPTSSIMRRKSDISRPDTRLYGELRQFLRQHMILDNTQVQRDITDYRSGVIRDQSNEAAVIVKEASDEWTIVGLAQRKGRRRWRNLIKVMEKLNESCRPQKIVFVQVNLDRTGVTAYDQLIMHGALDVLMGIHGAQLTEAVWMRPEAMVVEFLPWVPDNFSYGRWTRTLYKPTPLGVIFGDTDLTHVGVRLSRSSAPYCDDVTDEDACFNERKNRWDERDFIVEPALVSEALSRFWRETSKTCDDFYNKSRDTFVVYNVNCSEAGEPATPHQYYWPRDPVLDMTKTKVKKAGGVNTA